MLAQILTPAIVRATAPPPATPKCAASLVDTAAFEAAHEQETQVHAQALTQLQEARAKFDLAASKMESSRKFLQLVYAGRWITVLTTNWPTYKDLRRQASSTATQAVFCTICKGTERLPYCIICSDDKGKCVSCRGSGRASLDEICPTCLGKRKCFLCSGGGHMSCPFCIEGMVDTRQPPPANQLPTM